MDRNSNKKLTSGYVTLPAQTGCEREVLELAQKWGADAIRDSDGTTLSPDILKMGYDIYSTICLVRADQAWPRQHKEHVASKYLMSSPTNALSGEVEIDLLKSYCKEKYEIDTFADPYTWWEVIDRTSGRVVPASQWKYVAGNGTVIISNAARFHSYTVSFLVRQMWDSTSMYNHRVNNWTKDHVISIDPYYSEVREHLMQYFDNWLREHQNTDVVRLTTLAYHFVLDADEDGNDKYRDWLGYTDCINTQLLEDFAKVKGYRLRPEDIVDAGYYNATYRVPSKQYLEYMDFVHSFVVQFGKELVDKIHRAGKKAGIFWGDHWIGVEPYSPRFQEMGIDVNIGACEDGVALRRLADAPGPQTKEIRLYPYFFPDTFRPGGKPLEESISRWTKIRRALLRKPVDRIGYGGYMNLVLQFPQFVEHVSLICNEFREMLSQTQKTLPYRAPVKVAVLSAWGKLRSWINTISPDQKFHVGRVDVSDIEGSNLLECLSGLPIQVDFISFDDIKEKGIPEDVDVIINEGTGGTAWSGGRHWQDEDIVTAIKEWVHNGGGFLGVGEPSACEFQGSYFQLCDVLGVQKETGNSSMSAPVKSIFLQKHFITEDNAGTPDLGIEKSYVYPCSKETAVLLSNGGHVVAALNTFGQGRSLYLASLPYSSENSRLLLRSLVWLCKKEDHLKIWFSSNPRTDVAAFPETGMYAVVNNSEQMQQTTIFKNDGHKTEICLKPLESKWFPILQKK